MLLRSLSTVRVATEPPLPGVYDQLLGYRVDVDGKPVADNDAAGTDTKAMRDKDEDPQRFRRLALLGTETRNAGRDHDAPSSLVTATSTKTSAGRDTDEGPLRRHAT